MQSPPPEINVISLNCWGLKYIAKHRHARLAEIGRRIARANPVPDIVGLQECWTKEDYLSIRLDTKHILPYGKFYYSGIFGGGLVILSKWPIEQSSMFGYPLNGRPTAFWRGDWYVGKGVACASIRIGSGIKDVVEVFTTHLHAGYEKEPHDSYLCHRTAQAWEVAKLLRAAADRGHLVIALGDFNVGPLSLAHRIITSHAPVRDVWRVLHPDSSIGSQESEAERNRKRPIPTVDFNFTENGVTCDSVVNTWKWDKAHQKRLGPGRPVIEVPGDTLDPRGSRIDYVFVSRGSRVPEHGHWIAKSAKVGMTEPHPHLQCSLSDHFSVEATLGWQPDDPIDAPEMADGNGAQSQTVSDTFLERDPEEISYLPVGTYDEILNMINEYTLRERKQRRYRLYHFLGSLFISSGCLIAVWWSPRNFVSFLLMLLSTLGLSAGVVDGLIGGLFVGSELRALKEFEWEIRNARAIVGGAAIGDDFGIKDW